MWLTSPPNVLYYSPLSIRSIDDLYQLFATKYVLLITGGYIFPRIECPNHECKVAYFQLPSTCVATVAHISSSIE